MNQEILNPSAEFKKNRHRFSAITKALSAEYIDYKNRQKIIHLLEYWLFAVRSLYVTYGSEVFREFVDSDYNSINRFSLSYEGITHSKPEFYKKPNVFLCSFINLFLGAYRLPGADLVSNSYFGNLKNKIHSRISNLCSRLIPNHINNLLKINIIKIIKLYFYDIDDPEFFKGLEKKLPRIFYSNQVSNICPFNVVRIECSAACFQEFCGFEDILLFNKELYIEGLQHGGGYDNFEDDFHFFYEKQLTDVYYGWGLSEKNKSQHKFKSIDRININDDILQDIIWVEEAQLSLIYKLFHPNYYSQTNNRESVDYIFNELQMAEVECKSLIHPLNHSMYEDYRKNVIDRSLFKLGEDCIKANDLVLLNGFISSLFYYLLKNNIMFLVVINENDVDLFTEKQQKWYDVLRHAEMVFFNSEHQLLSKRLQEIKKYGLRYPDSVRDYHLKHFI